MSGRGKARSPALGTVALCSGSMVEIWHGAMSCVMSRNVKAVEQSLVNLRWGLLGSAMLCSGSWPALWYFALRLGLVGFVEVRHGS